MTETSTSGKIEYESQVRVGPSLMAATANTGKMAASNDTNESIATTFTKFKNLPTELRLKIWEMALPDARLFQASLGTYPCTAKLLGGSWKRLGLPNIMKACREAWEVTQAHGVFEFCGVGSTRSGGWFNPHRDVLLFSHETEELSYRAPHARLIGVMWYDLLAADRCIQLLELIVNRELLGLSCLSIVVVDALRGEHSHGPGIHEPRDGDIVFQALRVAATEFFSGPIRFDDGPVTWKQFMEGILGVWSDSGTLHKLHLTGAELPTILCQTFE